MKMNPMRVLVVDDETVIRRNVSEVLALRGYHVAEGCDGCEVATLAERENPAVIVMDVMMPRKSGFEALEELRSNPATEHIPVVMLTAVNDYELGAHHDADSVASTTGVRAPEAFIEKPFDMNQLLREVARTACR
ncbi:MAG: hypothetical protein RLZZ303_407 [Candidatus Hydrogenedentota bacterium]